MGPKKVRVPKQARVRDDVASGAESDASAKGSACSAASSAATSRSRSARRRSKSKSPKPARSFRARRLKRGEEIPGKRGQAVGDRGRPRDRGPKACVFSKALGQALGKEHVHTSGDPDPVEPSKPRVWADYTKDQPPHPRCGCCRCCKSVHRLLFPQLTQKQLEEELGNNEDAAKKFIKGSETWVVQEKAKLATAVQGLESDSGDDVRQKRKKTKKREIAAKQVLSSSPTKPQETATKSTVTADRVKRRGELVKLSVWEEENPGKVPDKKDTRIRTSRIDPTKELTYVKVYKVKDEDRLDFSEEEADVIAHDQVLDNGSQVLDEEQVSISV